MKSIAQSVCSSVDLWLRLSPIYSIRTLLVCQTGNEAVCYRLGFHFPTTNYPALAIFYHGLHLIIFPIPFLCLGFYCYSYCFYISSSSAWSSFLVFCLLLFSFNLSIHFIDFSFSFLFSPLPGKITLFKAKSGSDIQISG